MFKGATNFAIRIYRTQSQDTDLIDIRVEWFVVHLACAMGIPSVSDGRISGALPICSGWVAQCLFCGLGVVPGKESAVCTYSYDVDIDHSKIGLRLEANRPIN